jgi:hypothetical protein
MIRTACPDGAWAVIPMLWRQIVMPPAAAPAIIGVLFLVFVYLCLFIGTIWWCIYVALRLRDIGVRLETMSGHEEAQTRHLASIASSLAVIASHTAREAKLPPAPPREE